VESAITAVLSGVDIGLELATTTQKLDSTIQKSTFGYSAPPPSSLPGGVVVPMEVVKEVVHAVFARETPHVLPTLLRYIANINTDTSLGMGTVSTARRCNCKMRQHTFNDMM